MTDREAIQWLTESLPVSHRRKRAIARELEAHLEDSRRDLELAGWASEDAVAESFARLGDPDEIAAGLAAVHRRSRRAPVTAVLALTSALIVGMFSFGGSLASAHPAHHATNRVHVGVSGSVRQGTTLSRHTVCCAPRDGHSRRLR